MSSNIAPIQEEQGTLNAHDYIAFYVGDQQFGIPVSYVRDVFHAEKITRVPLAPKEIAGTINLRGRIVTAIDIRSCLKIEKNEDIDSQMNLAVDHHGDTYSLVVDRVGDVMSLSTERFEKNPVTLKGRLREIAAGIFKLDDNLMVVMNVEKVIQLATTNNSGAQND